MPSTAGSSRVRIQLDAEGYRAKRERAPADLARKVAGKVVKYRRSVTLEPMNAYERHVRGFIFSGSEIYGGLANTWDYGPWAWS